MRTAPLVGALFLALVAGCGDKPAGVAPVEKLGGRVEQSGDSVVKVDLMNAKVNDANLAELATKPELHGIIEL